MEAAHTKTVDEVLEFFGVTEEEGLTSERVASLREKYGANGEPLPEWVWKRQSVRLSTSSRA